MHGRLKVRSTAEQEAAKKKEREEKVSVYRVITGRIYEKRSAGCLDDEALQLTKNILSQNPEISTFWSYRREILEDKKKSLSEEDFSTLCDDELYLLESCLRVNPKSYGIWLHREWVMRTSPAPDWKNEKRLCDLFLKYDERNFHCWDYRRFVISHFPEITTKDEFDFTYEKIAANFSNYSAWHYRSKLLPQLHPSPSTEGGVAEEALLKEYELVQNAFFTDPSDQSAWFYHRWLLGKAEKPDALVCVYVTRSLCPAISVTFNQPVKVSSSRPLCITVGKTPINYTGETDWPLSFYKCSFSTDLLANCDDEIVIKVTFDNLEASTTLRKGESESWWLCGAVEDIFGSAVTVASTMVLQSELDSCLELLQLEPDNKWCVLTTLQLMQALDGEKYADQITEKFKQLCSIDPYRKGYYSDLLSKFTTEQALKQLLKDFSGNRTLNLSKKDLSKLYFPELMLLFETIDLSGNELLSLPSEVSCLSRVCCLVLDDNELEELPAEMKQLTNLKSLSLRNNNFSHLKFLECLPPQVEVLCLHGNPVCELEGDSLEKRALQVLVNLRELDGKTTKAVATVES